MIKTFKSVVTEKTEMSTLSYSKGSIQFRHQNHQDFWYPCPSYQCQNLDLKLPFHIYLMGLTKSHEVMLTRPPVDLFRPSRKPASE